MSPTTWHLPAYSPPRGNVNANLGFFPAARAQCSVVSQVVSGLGRGCGHLTETFHLVFSV